MLNLDGRILQYSNLLEPVSNIKCIAKYLSWYSIFQRVRVAQWIAHAIVCHVDAGSIPSNRKYFFLHLVA